MQGLVSLAARCVWLYPPSLHQLRSLHFFLMNWPISEEYALAALVTPIFLKLFAVFGICTPCPSISESKIVSPSNPASINIL